MAGEPTRQEQVREWYRLYGPMVLRRCRKLLLDKESALDALQTIFSRVLHMKKMPQLLDAPRYFYRCATHICIEMVRAQQRRPNVGQEILARIACADRNEESTLAGLFLQRLFSRQRAKAKEIAVMVHLDGMSQEETARALGLSVSTVKNRLKEMRLAARCFQDGRKP